MPLAALLWPILLIAQSGIGNATAAPDQKCVLQGRVTDAQTGEPIRKASVRLAKRAGPTRGMGANNSGPQGYAGTSEADGSFRFEAVEPGDYVLSGERAGYLTTQYGSKGPMQQGTRLELRSGQQMTGIALALIPQAAISGRVVDTDGDPVANVRLQVLAQTWIRGKERFTPRNGSGTNDRGEYRIANLSPGKYYLFAEKVNYGRPSNDLPAVAGKPDIRPVRTFYPEALSREAASPIQVRAGQDLAGVDIRMHYAQSYHVRGKVAGNFQEDEPERFNLSLTPRDDASNLFTGGQNFVNKDRSFDIPGVAPGAYYLSLMMMDGPVRSMTRQALDVGSADVNDVVLTVMPSGSLRGQIVVEGTPPADSQAANLANARVNLSPAEPGAYNYGFANASAKADGSFTLDNVAPGKYNVNANAPSGTYLKSIRFGSQEVLGKELDVSQGVSGELNVVFRYGAAEVDGSIQNVQSSSASGSSSGGQAAAPVNATVVLVPEALNSDGSGMRFSSADQNGTFFMKQIPPGTYRAYAFEQVNTGLLENPEVLKQLESKGTPVELKENDKKQVQLPIISADDFQRVLTRLGIDAQ